MNKGSENKIIKFPVEKIRESKSKPQGEVSKKDFLKKAAPATLFIVVCLFTINNIMVNNTHLDRTIASDDLTRDVQWEHQLARQLAEKNPTRGIAGIAKTPQIQEELTAGFLHNKYRVEFNNGKLKNIELVVVDEKVDPQYIDSLKFIKSYGDLLPFNSELSFEKKVEKSSDNKTLEKYLFLDENKNKSGEMHFELDQYGRLLSVKVEPIQS